MKRDQRREKAAERLADIFEEHFSKMPPAERDAKYRALREAIAKSGSRAKSAEPPRTAGSRRGARRPT